MYSGVCFLNLPQQLALTKPEQNTLFLIRTKSCTTKLVCTVNVVWPGSGVMEP